MTKETVMANFGVTFKGDAFDFGACSDMPGFTIAFTAACMAEAEAGRAKIAAEKKGRREPPRRPNRRSIV
jgi:hypothetical protein